MSDSDFWEKKPSNREIHRVHSRDLSLMKLSKTVSQLTRSTPQFDSHQNFLCLLVCWSGHDYRGSLENWLLTVASGSLLAADLVTIVVDHLKIRQLTAVSRSLLAAGLVMMIVNRMVSCGWQKHQDFCWLLDVGRFLWPMEDQEIGGITRKFDGRWLSRDHRGQRKVRSVGEIRNISNSLNFVSDSDFLERNAI